MLKSQKIISIVVLINIPFNSFLPFRIFPVKSHKIILSSWYQPVRFVLFCPQNLNETAWKSTKYTSFSGSGTLGDKILYGVVGEELFELAVELRRQGLIVGYDQFRNDP